MQAYGEERKFPRLEVDKAGVLENLDSGGQEQATLINFSGNGMCIESDRPCSESTRVRLIIESWSRENSYKSYTGKVVWCHAVKQKESRRYKIGVQIIASENNF